MQWVPTTEEKRIILAKIAHFTGLGLDRMRLDPTLRKNIRDTRDRVSMNVALVSRDPMYDDTEVVDYATWEEFISGVPLTRDGRALAIVDFVLRDRETWLPVANPVVLVDGGTIQSIVLRAA